MPDPDKPIATSLPPIADNLALGVAPDGRKVAQVQIYSDLIRTFDRVHAAVAIYRAWRAGQIEEVEPPIPVDPHALPDATPKPDAHSAPWNPIQPGVTPDGRRALVLVAQTIDRPPSWAEVTYLHFEPRAVWQTIMDASAAGTLQPAQGRLSPTDPPFVIPGEIPAVPDSPDNTIPQDHVTYTFGVRNVGGNVLVVVKGWGDDPTREYLFDPNESALRLMEAHWGGNLPDLSTPKGQS